MSSTNLLERAAFHFELIARRHDCIGMTLCHVDGNCTHCFAKMSAVELRRGTEIDSAGPLQLGLTLSIAELFASCKELDEAVAADDGMDRVITAVTGVRSRYRALREPKASQPATTPE